MGHSFLYCFNVSRKVVSWQTSNSVLCFLEKPTTSGGIERMSEKGEDYKIEYVDISLKSLANGFEPAIDPLVNIFLPQSMAMSTEIVHGIFRIPAAIKDASLYHNIYTFVKAIKKNPQEAISFSNKLFGNEQTARENAVRLIKYIDKVETNKVLHYLLSASRALGNNLISEQDYFRIVRAIIVSLPEDLEYLKKVAPTIGTIEGNMQIIQLSSNGLMIQAGTNGNKDVEKQDYIVSLLGKYVDYYALSYDDEERSKYWRQHLENDVPQKYDVGHLRPTYNEKTKSLTFL